MATTTKQTNSRVDELLREHRELVAEYAVKTGAARAQVSRKLNLVQVELDLLGADYDFWTRPEPTVTRTWIHSEEDLLARIEGLRKQLTRGDRPAAHIAAVDRELSNALAQAAKRGITVPEA